MIFRQHIFLALTVLLVAVVPVFAVEDIKVPFNFQWGESVPRLEESMLKAQAKIVDRKQVQGRMCLTVEGIPQKLLQRALFYFDNDSLNEIELHYGDPKWDSLQFGNFFDQTRRNIESKYGIGRVIARQKTREGDVLQTLIGYQWTQSVTSLSLYYYTAERTTDSYRVLSLHYRGF